MHLLSYCVSTVADFKKKRKKKAVALTSGAHLLNNQNLAWFQSNCQSHAITKVGGLNDQRSSLFYILIDGYFLV